MNGIARVNRPTVCTGAGNFGPGIAELEGELPTLVAGVALVAAGALEVGLDSVLTGPRLRPGPLLASPGR